MDSVYVMVAIMMIIQIINANNVLHFGYFIINNYIIIIINKLSLTCSYNDNVICSQCDSKYYLS